MGDVMVKGRDRRKGRLVKRGQILTRCRWCRFVHAGRCSTAERVIEAAMKDGQR